jgi:hypothetical protein
MDTIISKILFQIDEFLISTDWSTKMSSFSGLNNKYLLINNSFPFRDNKARTKKSEYYLGILADKNKVTETDVFVLSGITINKDYSLIARNDSRIIDIIPLADFVRKQLALLGDLVLILISEIDDSLIFESSVDHQLISKIILNSSLPQLAMLDNSVLYVKNIDETYQIWQYIESNISTTNDVEKLKLRQAMMTSFGNLQKEAYARLIIPKTINPDTVYFLDSLVLPLKDQLIKYQDEITNFDLLNLEIPLTTELLRIAYNFTDDAMKIVRLLVQVSDLKPILLFGTFLYQYRFSTALKNLPWATEIKKPKLSDYKDQIAKVRNKAFHRLLPISKSYDVEVPDDSLRDVRLRIFSEYSGKTNSNSFSFRDKELVDILLEFNRTSEELVDRMFWERNIEVMRSVINLVEEMSAFLKICKQTINETESA